MRKKIRFPEGEYINVWYSLNRELEIGRNSEIEIIMLSAEEREAVCEKFKSVLNETESMATKLLIPYSGENGRKICSRGP